MAIGRRGQLRRQCRMPPPAPQMNLLQQDRRQQRCVAIMIPVPRRRPGGAILKGENFSRRRCGGIGKPMCICRRRWRDRRGLDESGVARGQGERRSDRRDAPCSTVQVALCTAHGFRGEGEGHNSGDLPKRRM